MIKKLLLFLLISNVGFSQVVINEDFLKVTHYKDDIIISPENSDSKFLSATFEDANTNEKLNLQLQSESNGFLLKNAPKGKILKAFITTATTTDTIVQKKYIATASMSTGEIKVYFNHPLDYSVATPGNNGVNLGNTLDDKLINLINTCQNTLDIAIYNSSSPTSTTGIAGAINAAYSRGVQVRVIYDGGTTSGMIALLNGGIPKLPSPGGANYTIMHNKFVIFDANHLDANIPLVWTGATNWTVAQIDGPDMNNVITIQDQSLALGYKIEFEEMWGSSTMTPDTVNSKFGQYKTDNTPHNYVIGGKIVESYFSPSDGVTSKIIDVINSGSTDINICTMLITRDGIRDAIINKYNSGLINTNLVVDTQNPAGNDFPAIQAAIAPNHAVVDTRTGVMHHKFVVIDNFNAASDPLVLTGSHNWSSGAETDNDENTLVVHDAAIANQYYQAFYFIYNAASGTLGINEFLDENTIVLYPNPAIDFITISGLTNEAKIEIFSMTGLSVYQGNYKNNEKLRLNLASGVYMIKVVEDNKSVIKKLIIK